MSSFPERVSMSLIDDVAALLVHDNIITLKNEIEVIWRRGSMMITFLYLGIRYTTTISFVLSALLLLNIIQVS